jgi:hypothetical protein
MPPHNPFASTANCLLRAQIHALNFADNEKEQRVVASLASVPVAYGSFNKTCAIPNGMRLLRHQFSKGPMPHANGGFNDSPPPQGSMVAYTKPWTSLPCSPPIMRHGTSVPDDSSQTIHLPGLTSNNCKASSQLLRVCKLFFEEGMSVLYGVQTIYLPDDSPPMASRPTSVTRSIASFSLPKNT